MNKKLISMLASILAIAWMAFPLYANAETLIEEPPQAELIGTITITEDGDIVVAPKAAALLTCSLKTSAGKYYAYAKISSAISTSLQVSVYLRTSSGSPIASSSNSGTGTVLTTSTPSISLDPGVYEVYASGSSNSSPVSMTRYFSVS